MNQRVPTPACSACGALPPADSQFCPECGHALEVSVVSYDRTEKHVFGVAPPALLIGLAVACFVVSLLLLAFGHWLVAVVLLIASLCFTALFAGAARQLPEAASTKAVLSMVVRTRGWAGLARVSAASWTRAGQAVVRLRAEQRRLRRAQRRRIHALGDAVYNDDEAAAEALKGEARALAERMAEAEQELHRALDEASERVSRERTAARSTVVR